MHTFLDEATIHVQAGNGGNGSMHFHREKYVPHGGPDGGDGGTGGDVILRANRSINTLFTFRRQRRFAAENGQAGGRNRMHGRNGKDLVVDVPIGTVIRDAETAETLADLTEDNQMVVVARGGKGGLGNVHFKTSTNQAPSFAEKGEPGEARWLELELKVIADAGLIGLPNAGKSTLLSVISAARPKIADYPFTTLSPNLGVVDVGDYTFVVADIPGLIEGAHEGVGLGHEFLRHIERTLVLVHIIDGGLADPIESFHQINRELALYDQSLLDRPQLVAVNKIDLPDARDRLPALRRDLESMGYPVFPISAVTREGLEPLIYRMAEIIQQQAREIEAASGDEVEVITIKPSPDRFEVTRKRGTYHVVGENAHRLAVMTDLSSSEAVYRLQRRLKRMGLFAALQREGIRDGNKVRIGTVEFTWNADREEIVPQGTSPSRSPLTT